MMLSSPEQAQNLVSQGATPGERIASTISYLVFFKTLTTVITNFNASSAGFNFEAFLAVLLGGAQIPASGATTIADLTAADGTPISLKLYAEKIVPKNYPQDTQFTQEWIEEELRKLENYSVGLDGLPKSSLV